MLKFWKWKLAFDLSLWVLDIAIDSFGLAWAAIVCVVLDLACIRDCLPTRGAR